MSVNENNLGKLLYEFMNHYGLKFDSSNIEFMLKKEYDEEILIFNIQIGSELVIIDFLNSFNNV